MPLTAAQAANAPQPLELAGETFLVAQLRLRDWGELQGWLLSRRIRPPVVAIDRLGDLPEAEWEAVAFHNRLALAWPPSAGTGAWFRVLLDTPGGAAEFLRVALGRHRAGFSGADAAALIGRLAPAEWGALVGLCVYGDPEPEAPGPRRDEIDVDDWGPTLAWLLERHPGWTYADAAGGLTFAQLRNEREASERERGKAGHRRPTAAEARAAIQWAKNGKAE